MKKLLSIGVAVLLSTSMLAGCGSSSNTKTTTLKISGSTSMEKVTGALKESFEKEFSQYKVDLQLGGSSTGISNVIDGISDIGNASRSLKKSETDKGATPNIIAIDTIAVITNPKNTVKEISKDNLVKIYTGEIKNWKQLGGNDENIVVVGREASSGTRGAFEEILGLENKAKYAQELAETGTVKTVVASQPGAIGYVSMEAVDKTVIALKYEGVEPTVESTKSKAYKLSRDFVMATKKDKNEATKAFLDYVYSEKGKAIIAKVGLVPVEKQ